MGAVLRAGLFLAMLATLMACAPAPSAGERGGGPSGQAAPAVVQHPLIIIGGRAPESIASRPLRQIRGSGSPAATFRTFNAGLALNNERAIPEPYLALALPQLDTETWRVFPDGRMETTFVLRPGLTWHDGNPLQAGDFVFSYRVYSSPDLGLPDTPPFNYIDGVEAPDPATVIVRWRQPYAEAAALDADEFPPLPRHLLEATYEQRQPDAFTVLPFWTTEYVAAGPYKVTQFDLGSQLEGVAFDGHALGRPRIDRVRFLYMNDANAALANVLAGSANVVVDNSIDQEQAAVLDREWAGQGGTVLRNPVGIRHVNYQMRPELASP